MYLTTLEIKKAIDTSEKRLPENGKGREALNIMRRELNFCMSFARESRLLVDYGRQLIVMLARNNGDFTELDERVLLTTIKALRDAKARQLAA